jgi:phosphoglycerate dehydrogenase-like enzyme
LNEETRGIIGEKEMKAMKQGSILINTARGALVEENTLITMLTPKDSGECPHLLAAGLDVLTAEPVTKNHPLYFLPNVVLTPHVGANTEEALYRVGMACVEGIRDALIS